MKNTRARKNLGESAERVAALLLQQRGYKIITRNFRTRTGEMDIVAEDADGLAFVEVRARRGNFAGTPEESVTPPRKRARLFAVAEEFLSANPQYENRAWRVDLVAIELDRTGRVVRTDVVKNAVEG